MKLKLLVAAACAAFGTALFAAGELDEAVLHGETDKARAIDYAPGETITFTLTLQGAKPFAEGAYFIQWKRSGDDGVVEEGKEPASPAKPFVYYLTATFLLPETKGKTLEEIERHFAR